MIEIVRSFPGADIDVTGRTLEGEAVAWDVPYRVSDDGGARWYHEGWRRRSFTRAIEARRNAFEMRVEHADVRLGLVSFTEADSGLVFRAVIDDGDDGDDALELVRSGRRRGVSIRYLPERQARDRHGVIWRLRAGLRELSLTRAPQYAGAGVTTVRSVAPDPVRAARDRRVAEMLAWVPPTG